MTYPQALEYLYSHLPMYQRVGKVAYKKDLTNTLLLLGAMGNPHQHLRTIHVAGTNGKGSVSSMLASILTEAGYRTGLYTSPHLKSFTERIRINGAEIAENAVVDFVLRMRETIAEIEPSFFEATVAMCFDYFARQQTDIAVIEVGLGGRLDSTNVIVPEVSIITNISYDHMDLLGDTLAQIAGEKAGIIKPEVPVIIGQRHPETTGVFEQQAARQNSPLIWAEEAFPGALLVPPDETGMQTIQAGSTSYRTDLTGVYQRHNLPAAVTAVAELRKKGWHIPEEAVVRGLARVRANAGLRGRFEQLAAQPLTLCDTGHNEAGIQSVMSQLMPIFAQKQQQFPEAQLRMVIGMVSDKDHSKVLRLLPQEAVYYFVRPDVPRGMDAAALRDLAAPFGLTGAVFASVAEGLACARAESHAHDVIFAGGSTFVVAEVL